MKSARLLLLLLLLAAACRLREPASAADGR